MMLDACAWDNPGADRYTGTAEAAIHAYTEIPKATRDKLAARWSRHEMDDFVYISRAGIHGKDRDYERRISRMHFGSRGRICNSVSIDGWADSHVETAIVVCADGWCLAAPTVCSNWFILGDSAFREFLPPADVPMPAVPAPDGGAGVVPLTPFAVPAGGEPTFEGYSGGSYGFAGGGWYGGGGGGSFGPPAAFLPPPGDIPTPGQFGVTPIPEPGEWALFAAGIAAIFWRVRRGQVR